MPALRIDSHQHFWKYDPVRDSWITEEMAVIRKDLLPGDLAPVLWQNKIDGCIAVQADQSEQENAFLLDHAEKYDFIKGVVGWVDFRGRDVDERLAYYSSFPKMKGFRHILQGEKQRDLMLDPDFMYGISHLKKYNFTYDILIYPDQLKYVPEFVSAFPDQLFVIDHIAKPNIKDKKIAGWSKDLQKLGPLENVYCKISGLVTEADAKNWKQPDFKPYLDLVVEVFGTKRVMFGSDWPVCLLAADYAEAMGIVEEYFSSFSGEEQADFFGRNALNFYRI